MLLTSMNGIFLIGTKLFLMAVGLLYLAVVLTAFRMDGPSYRPRMTLDEPLRSSLRLVIWLGVRALAALVRITHAALETLFDASADVGEWYLHRHALSHVDDGPGRRREM